MSSLSSPAHLHPMPFTRIELAVMSIVDGGLVVLLGKRAEVPHKGKWALPGGVLRIDLDRDLDAAALRVADERLGVELPYLRQLKAVGGVARDPRAPWALSIAYRALIPVEAIDPSAGKRLEAIKWFAVEETTAELPLAFDHADLIRLAIETTRMEIENLELPFEFLPKMFTLGELQACCEAILGHSLYKANFRQRIDARDLVEIVPGQMRTGAFRPAQLYCKR